jgi:hypothetical protein
MTVGITDDQIHVKHYNEIGDKWRFNNQYEEDGSLHISKSSEEISIESSGELKLLDDSVALIRFDFEEITPLGTRQVLGFHGDKTALMANGVCFTCKTLHAALFSPNFGNAQPLYFYYKIK